MNYLQDIYQQTNYEKYLCEKFKWNKNTFNSINWPQLSYHCNTLPLPQKVQYIKFLHKWRPTQKNLFYSNSVRCSSPACLLCGEQEDNDDHLFHCTHPIMRDAQMETLATLRTALQEIEVSVTMIESIVHYIKSWMRITEPTFITKLSPSIPLHKIIIQAITEQDKIGWDHFVRGRQSKLWIISQTLSTGRRPSLSWQHKFFMAIQKINSTLWEVRNTLQYGNGKEKLTREQRRLAPTITELYNSYTHHISTKHYNIFNTPLAQRLQFSPTENKQWIKTVKAAQKFYKREQYHFYKQHTKITRFFQHKKRPLNTSTTPQENNSGKKHKTARTSTPNTGENPRNTQSKLPFYPIQSPPPTDDPT